MEKYIMALDAGICGCASARKLSRKQTSILVVERAEDVCCGIKNVPAV